MHSQRLLVLSSIFAFVTRFTFGQDFEPGDQHKLLKQFAGEWKADCVMKLPDFDKPLKYSAEYSAKMDVGDLFLISEFVGGFGDKQFKGRGITGFDPHKKSFVGVWIETGKPGITNIRGKWDEAGKIYTESMTGTEPDGKEVKFEVVTEFKNANLMITKSTFGPAGKQVQLEMTFTRKK